LISFWGGGVDTQHTLPYGSPEEVFNQVSERIRIYNQNGGFVFNTIHNTQPGVPVENFLAMIEAIKQFRL
ncbi:MAG: uroporphyrinogen decarboxylase family protein, partial [Treponema sp.]|nr:uroporphyrinogen decarboxylase family protein [Treponema sp.]